MSQIKTKFIQNSAVTTAKIADANVTSAKLASDLALAGNPTAATQSAGDSSTRLATTAFVQTAVTNAVQGLDPKESVRAATTANITLSGTQTIDGVALSAGNRVLVKNQTTGSENGIYVVAAGAWSRSSDADSSAEVTAGMFCFVEEGSTYAETGWVLSTDNPITLDTTSLAFVQFNGAASIVAGAGLTKSGNTIDVGAGHGIQVDSDSITVNLDGSTLSKSASGLKVADGGIANAQVSASAAIAYSKLALSNSIVAGDLTSDSVTTAKILDANVTAAKLASDSVTTAKILDSNVTTAKLADDSVTAAKLNSDVAGNGLSQAVGGELDVNVDGTTLEINTDALRVKDAGISAAKLASDSVTTVKILDANVTTAKIADSAVTSGKIAALAIDNSHVSASAAIAYSKLALSNSIVAGDLTSDSVTTAKIQDSAVTAGKLASDSVTTIKILDANVTAAKLASDSVTTAKILDANVTAAKLASDSVTTAKILDANVTNAKLAGSITGDKLLAARYSLTLSAGDITAQYVEITASQKLSPESVELMIDGVMQAYGVDYDIDNSGAQSKIRFDSTNLPSSDLATGGAAALVATDVLRVRGIRIA